MPTPDPASDSPEELAGPRYRLDERFARGGMGALWRARESGTDRSVALKRILHDADPESLRRFLTEARITAQLEHPNIVPIHGLGTDADGKPFYTMKLVRGIDLDVVLKKLAADDAETLAAYPLAQLLIVFQKVCDAIAFAHSRRIIHRDLKPANIMLGPFGEVLVMDWGLAKVLVETDASTVREAAPIVEPSATSGDETATIRSPQAEETMPGYALGSPHFMAPEQARGEVHRHDPRTDIYALGAILYQLLSLRRCVSGSSVHELLQRVRTGDLDPLVLPRGSAASKEDDTIPAELRPPKIPRPELRHLPERAIPASLAAVVRHAMAFEPENRYPSVPEFQREITAYQNGFATSAENAGLGKQFFLALRRHRREATVAGTLLLILLAFAVASFLRIRHERDLAEQQRGLAEKQRKFAEEQIGLTEEQRQRADHESTAARQETEQRQHLLEEAARTDRLTALEKWRDGKASAALALLARALRYTPSSSFPAEAALPIILSSGIESPRVIYGGHTGEIFSANFSPDGQRVLTASGDKTARLWDTRSGKLLIEFKGHDSSVISAVFSPDGQHILTVSDRYTARLWDPENGHSLAEFQLNGDPLTGPQDNAVFSPDGGRILTTLDNSAVLRDVQNGKILIKLEGHTSNVTRATFSPDGHRVLTVSDDGTARLWDAQSGKSLPEFKGPPAIVLKAIFSPDARCILTVCDDDGQPTNAWLWDAQNGKMLVEMTNVGSLDSDDAVFSPDGRYILTGPGNGNSGRLWDTRSGKMLIEFKGYTDTATSAVFSPDGRHVFTASYDHTATIWDTQSGLPVAKCQGASAAPVFSPDGRRVLTTSGDAARLWDAQDGGQLAEFENINPSTSAVFSPDGRQLLTVSNDKTARLWDAQSGQCFAQLNGHTAIVESAVFSPDGRYVFTDSYDHTARLWDAQSGQPLAEFERPAILSPDGHRVLTVPGTTTARLWDARSGKSLFELKGSAATVSKALFSPDGRRILIASSDRMARLWDAQSGQPIADLKGHINTIHTAIFSSDSDRVLTASFDDIALWNTDTGKHLANFLGHTDGISSAVFSPDNHCVLTASYDHTARLWDAQSGQPLAEFKGHTGSVDRAVFSHNGSRVFTASSDQTGRLWDAKSGQLLVEFKDFTDGATAVLFNANDRRVLTISEDENASKTAQLLDAESGRSLARISGPFKSFMGVIFSPDGHRVLSTSASDFTRLWDSNSGQLIAEFRNFSGSEPAFSPDSRRILTTSSDDSGTVELSDVIPPNQPPPAWFGEFLVAVAGQHLDEDGSFKPLVAVDANIWSQALIAAASQPGENDYLKLLRWCMKPASERSIDPYSDTSRQQAAANLLLRMRTASDVERVYFLDPMNPLVHLALAGFEKDEIAADFLRCYSLDRLPDDPTLQLRAAELLTEQKQPKWALGYVERVLFRQPNNPKALALRERLRKEN